MQLVTSMRITGGVFRSRTLVAPRGQETRPTSDRVREAVFSMLTSAGVFGAGTEREEAPRVLDLYAGSGALGFEALSRGASEVVFVESAKPAIEAIGRNASALGVVDQVTVLAMRAERALTKLAGVGPSPRTFELVLVDPPYADVRAHGFAVILERAAQLLSASGVLLLEHASADEPDAPVGLDVDRRRKHGDTTVSLFRRAV